MEPDNKKQTKDGWHRYLGIVALVLAAAFAVNMYYDILWLWNILDPAAIIVLVLIGYLTLSKEKETEDQEN